MEDCEGKRNSVWRVSIYNSYMVAERNASNRRLRWTARARRSTARARSCGGAVVCIGKTPAVRQDADAAGGGAVIYEVVLGYSKRATQQDVWAIVVAVYLVKGDGLVGGDRWSILAEGECWRSSSLANNLRIASSRS